MPVRRPWRGTCVQDENSLHYLVAYIMAGKDCTLHKVREWLKSKLTYFMIPEFL